jgi:hypothetical protein
MCAISHHPQTKKLRVELIQSKDILFSMFHEAPFSIPIAEVG